MNNIEQKLRDIISRDSANTKPSEDIQTEKRQSENHQLGVKNANQVRKLRWVFALVIVGIAVAHLWVLYYFINKNGQNNISHNLPFISDKVMLMFLATTTADVFGLLFIMAKFLFPIGKNKS